MKWFRAFGRRKPPQPPDLVAAIGARTLTIVIKSETGLGAGFGLTDDTVALVIAPGFALRLYEPLMTRGTKIKNWTVLRAMLTALAPCRIIVQDPRALEDQSGLLDWIAQCEATGVKVIRCVMPA